MPESIYYQNRHELQRVFAEDFLTVVGLSRDEVIEPVQQHVRTQISSTEQEAHEDVLRSGLIFENRQVPKPWRTAMAHVAGILTVRHALTADELREQTCLSQDLFDTATTMLTRPLPPQYAPLPNSAQTVVIEPSEGNNWQYQSSELLRVLAGHAEEHFPSLHNTIELYKKITVSDNS